MLNGKGKNIQDVVSETGLKIGKMIADHIARRIAELGVEPWEAVVINHSPIVDILGADWVAGTIDGKIRIRMPVVLRRKDAEASFGIDLGAIDGNEPTEADVENIARVLFNFEKGLPIEDKVRWDILEGTHEQDPHVLDAQVFLRHFRVSPRG